MSEFKHLTTIGLYTQPLSFDKDAPVSGLAFKRVELAGKEMDAIIVIPKILSLDTHHTVIPFSDAAHHIFGDSLVQSLAKTKDVNVVPIRGGSEHYYIVTGDIEAAYDVLRKASIGFPLVLEALQEIGLSILNGHRKYTPLPTRTTTQAARPVRTRLAMG
jgi:hypothetical protein